MPDCKRTFNGSQEIIARLRWGDLYWVERGRDPGDDDWCVQLTAHEARAIADEIERGHKLEVALGPLLTEVALRIKAPNGADKLMNDAYVEVHDYLSTVAP